MRETNSASCYCVGILCLHIFVFHFEIIFSASLLFNQISVGVANYSRRTIFYFYAKLLFLNLLFHDCAGGVLELIVLNRDNLLLHITTNQCIFKYLMFELVGVSESFFSSFHSYWIITTLSAS
jgi:hypothetical protein